MAIGWIRIVAMPLALFTAYAELKAHIPDATERPPKYRTLLAVLGGAHTHEEHDRFAGVDVRNIVVATTSSTGAGSFIKVF